MLKNRTKDFLRAQERYVSEVSGRVVVTDGFGRLVADYDAVELGVEWFKMSNDLFATQYGFSWTPKGDVYAKASAVAHGLLRGC